MVNVIISSLLSSDDGRINVKSSTPLALSDALKTTHQLYSASRVDSEFSKVLTSLATRLNSKIEKAIVDALGGTQIRAGRGGFFPDFYVKDEVTGEVSFIEQKLVSTVQEGDQVKRKGKVGLAGGSGITIQPGINRLFGGFTFDASTGDPIQRAPVRLDTTNLYKSLLKNKDKPEALLKVLNSSDPAAMLIKDSLIVKANSIDIPIMFNGKLQNRTLKFSWSDIQKSLKTGKMKLKVTPAPATAKNVSIKFNLYFTGGTITKALNSIEAEQIKDLNGDIGTTVLKALSRLSTLPNGRSLAEIVQFLESKGMSHALRYVAGSAIIARGVVAFSIKNGKKPDKNTQRFISGVQFTALVREHMRKNMSKYGKPNPPTLKERTGTFRKSIIISPNYKTSTISYYYNPLYSSLDRYGYKPDEQVEGSIRQVAQMLFSQKFQLRRSF